MSDTDFPSRPQQRRPCRQKGLAAVEFALVCLVFFTLVFGVIETARLMYLYNTLQEVTRRAASAAANTDPTDRNALDGVRRSAIFGALKLPLSSEITPDAVRIEFMSIKQESDGSFTMNPVSAPLSPVQNRKACVLNPYGDTCIRLVRVRICDPTNGTDCVRIPFQGIVPLVNLAVSLPRAPTHAKAESLGLPSGS
jgi:hypothetical protein